MSCEPSAKRSCHHPFGTAGRVRRCPIYYRGRSRSSFPGLVPLLIMLISSSSILAVSGPVTAQTISGNSHGHVSFDIKSYVIRLRIDPTAKSIFGTVTIRALVRAQRLNNIVLDLSDAMEVTSIETPRQKLSFIHRENLLA